MSGSMTNMGFKVSTPSQTVSVCGNLAEAFHVQEPDLTFFLYHKIVFFIS